MMKTDLKTSIDGFLPLWNVVYTEKEVVEKICTHAPEVLKQVQTTLPLKSVRTQEENELTK